MSVNHNSAAGLLITFEGGEGAGKTSLAKKTVNWLKKSGFTVTVAREPGGTKVGEKIRRILLTKRDIGVKDITEVFLFQAGRAQVYQEIVQPALARGEIVVMDRSGDSSVVYQGIVKNLGATMIANLNHIAMLGIKPNLTFLLDVDPQLGLERQQANEQTNRFELAGLAFHNQVRAGYLSLYEKNRDRMIKIDANQSLAKNFAEVKTVLTSKLCKDCPK